MQVTVSVNGTEYAREVRRDHGLSFSVRMGINSGEVVVGTVGDDLHMDYTALGHTDASFSEPTFLRHLLGGIRWAMGAAR